MKRILLLFFITGGVVPLLIAREPGTAKKPSATISSSGLYGTYPFTREATGTSWQPESSLPEAVHAAEGNTMAMLHGYLYGIYDHQGGPRGGGKTYTESMFGLVVRQGLKNGTLGFRAMVSFDASQGKRGYPLLFQTGEQADGEALIDQQHPHDFFSELAVTYSKPVGKGRSLFIYAGLPGEPALGPPAYVERFSGAFTNPEAPLGHHWLDSTHITFGVITVGYIKDRIKLEASAFRGREPDDLRWNIETPKLDSYAGRITCNPSRNFSLQASYGRLESPEELFPGVNSGRYTASVMYNAAGKNSAWQTTLAWGMNVKDPGPSTDALLLESALQLRQKHTFFGRLEQVEKDELFVPGDPLAGRVFSVGKGSIGYSFRFLTWKDVGVDAGGLISGYFIPDALRPAYGDAPVSCMLFVKGQFI